MKRTLALTVGGLLLIGSAAGCATGRGAVTRVTPPKAPLGEYTGLAITSTMVPGLKLTDTDRARIVALVVETLQQRAPGRFTLTLPAGPGTLHATIAFREYDEGSRVARAFLAGAGKMRIAADVFIEDRARKLTLGTYDVTKTFAWGGLYGATTELKDIEQGFADAVVAALLGETS